VATTWASLTTSAMTSTSTRATDARESSTSPSEGSPVSSFFFIVGCPRSGTTLLRWMLDSHPTIAVTPETHFGERYLASRDRGASNSVRDARTSSGALDLFCQSCAFEELSIDERAFRERAGLTPADPWAPLRVAMEDFARLRNASIVGEKTPSHSLHLDALAEAFPRARFLMLVRDPRAVAASWHRASWSHHSTTQIAETWCRYARAMRRTAGRLDSRCLEISYEELVQAPALALASICEFLGTGFDSRMLRYHEAREDTRSPEERSDHALTFGLPKPERIGAWRTELSHSDLCQIEAICAGPMARRGYSPVTSRLERAPDALRSLPSSWRKRIKRRLRGRR
jgi:hypothetical protein